MENHVGDWNHETNGEMFLWQNLQPHVKIMFDIGCRTDDYYFNQNSSTVFHLFEPNPIFYAEISRKSSKNVVINNVAIGQSQTTLPYYEKSQSFVKRPICGDTEPTMILPVTTLKVYMMHHNISKIDFLKIDTEGFEIDVLLGLEERISDCENIQFEYGGTYKDRNVKLQHVYDLLKDFAIFIVGKDGLYSRPRAIEHNQYSNYLATRDVDKIRRIIKE